MSDYSELVEQLKKIDTGTLAGYGVVLKAIEAITTLQRQLAEANSEVDRLNKWADDFTDRHLKERQTGDVLVKELQKTITAQHGEQYVKLSSLVIEYDRAPIEQEWEHPHPIFQLAQERDDLTAECGKLRNIIEHNTKVFREAAETLQEKVRELEKQLSPTHDERREE